MDYIGFIFTTDLRISGLKVLEASNKHFLRIDRALIKARSAKLRRPHETGQYLQIDPLLTHFISHRHRL